MSKRTSNSGPITQGPRFANSKKDPKRVSTIPSEYLTSSGPIEFVSYKHIKERNGVSRPESSQDKNPPLSSSAEESIKKLNRDQVDMKKSTGSCKLEDSKAAALVVS